MFRHDNLSIVFRARIRNPPNVGFVRTNIFAEDVRRGASRCEGFPKPYTINGRSARSPLGCGLRTKKPPC
ncbi:Uncharacterised protein [Chlamydia trachomatis]|nr:Uncharacterised protein [Chlamydia trachomatis]